MLFKEKLKELREERGLTQKNIALACDLTPTCICQLETGARNPTGSTLVALANFFDVSIDYLMGETEDESRLSFTDKDRALGVVENAPVALSDKDRELIHLFDEAERKLGVDYVQGVKQMVRLAIDLKK